MKKIFITIVLLTGFLYSQDYVLKDSTEKALTTLETQATEIDSILNVIDVNGDADLAALALAVQELQYYRVIDEARIDSLDDRVSVLEDSVDWLMNHQVVTDTIAPVPPTNLTVTGYAGAFLMEFTAPTTIPDSIEFWYRINGTSVSFSKLSSELGDSTTSWVTGISPNVSYEVYAVAWLNDEKSANSNYAVGTTWYGLLAYNTFSLGELDSVAANEDVLFPVTNSSSYPITVTALNGLSAPYSTTTSVPFTVNAGASTNITIRFNKDQNEGTYLDTLAIVHSYATQYAYCNTIINVPDPTPVPERTIDYYVSASGSSGNSGLDEAHPKNFAFINSNNWNTAVNGEVVVALKRGDQFRATLNPQYGGTSETNRLIITSYGTGRNPQIMGSTSYLGSTGDWTNMGSNIWRRTISAPTYLIFNKTTAASTTNWGYPQISQANCNADYRYYVSGGYVYVYATSNPTSYYTQIENTSTRTPVYLSDYNTSYITLDSLEIYGGGEANIRIDYPSGQHLTVQYCDIHHTGNVQNVEGDLVYHLSPYGLYRYNKIWEAGSHLMWIGGFWGMPNDYTIVEHNYLAGNYYTCIDFQHTDETFNNTTRGLIARYNWINNDSLRQGAVYHNGQWNAGIQVLGMRYGSNISTIKNTQIYGNVIIGCTEPINLQRFSDSIYVYNNTIISSGSSNFRETQDDGWTTATGYWTKPAYIEFKNNVVANYTSGTLVSVWVDTNKVFDYNAYLSTSTSPFVINRRVSYTTANFSTYRTWIDGETNSGLTTSLTNAFENWTSATATKDLRPKVGGVLINTGVDLGAPYNIDIYGNTRSGTWDIGAIER